LKNFVLILLFFNVLVVLASFLLLKGLGGKAGGVVG